MSENAPVPEQFEYSDELSSALESTRNLVEAIGSGADEASGRLVPTGFADLDDLLGAGIWPGHLCVIGGRPGAGTSTLAQNIAAHAAGAAGLRVLFMSADTSADELNMRWWSARAKVPIRHIRHGLMSDDDWSRFVRAADFGTWPVHVNTNPRLTVASITEAVEELLPLGLKLLVVDGLQSLAREAPRDSRYFEVCEDVHALKRLARQHGLAVIIVSKLNRSAEQRPDKRPMLHELRNAGDIEDVADEVVLLHREDLYERESMRPGEADLILAKNRHGPERDVVVAFQGHYARFVDMAN